MNHGKQLIGIALAAATVMTGAAFAQQKPGIDGAALVASEPGKVAAGDIVTATAVVTAIDAATRTVTLKGPQGNTFRVVAGPEVRNFAQIKVGDELIVTHAEALSLELKKGAAGLRERVESESTERAPAGAKPGGMTVRTVTITANVIAVNARTQTVTLRGPEHVVDLRVRDPAQFKLIKVGDQVVARYTDALAISMEPKR
ncbi:MAG: hypothetical protein U5L03_08880 [Burkholderiaceae bacterium]|nr:hypothetical protein [Burkholderiaceae bacterium]